MDTYIMTIPRQYCHKRLLRIMIDKNDCKKWIIAKETGKNGLEHWQIRLSTSNKNFFDWAKENIPQAHIEKASTGDDTYERKDGYYWSSEDTKDIRKVRFGALRPNQRLVLQTVNTQNDREVDVWLDPEGCHGKTWLTLHLFETGQGFVVPRASTTPEKLSAYVCSAYRGEPYIIIDIPRAKKPDKALYEAIEELKDGLVFDGRYSGHARNIRGAKIIIFTNTPLDLKQLSKDRWRLHGM